MKKTLISISTLALFAGAAMAAETFTGDISNQIVEDGSLKKVTSSSELIVDNSRFSQNQVSSDSNSLTGAILMSDTSSVLSVKNSTFSGNIAETTAESKPTDGGVIGFQGKGSIEGSSFVGNTAKSMYLAKGAAVNISGGSAEGVNIANSSFIGNSAISTDGWYGSASMGGAIASYGANVTIDGSTFRNNVADSDGDVSLGNWSLGGAVCAQSAIWGGQNPTNVKISNSVFDGNKAGDTNCGAGGAIYIEDLYKGTLEMNTIIADTVFTNNTATEGGAVYVGGSDITLKVSAGKNLSYAGNVATEGDAAGGFIYIYKPNAEKYPEGKGSATFDVDGSLTIGNGKAGYDSIASGSQGGSTITKTGIGTLTVNSSMEYFKDSLVVSEGIMNVNSVLGASSVSIADGASLGLTVGGANVLSNSSLAFENGGTFVLKAGAALAAGEYDISAAGITDYGNTKAYGGSISGNKFIVAEAEYMNLDKTGEQVAVSDNGRLNLSREGSTETTIVMAFNSANATVNAVNTTTDSLATQLSGDFAKVAAYSFDVDMASDDTVTLSFLVGDSSLSLSDFTIFHKNSGDSQWSKADDISDAAYDGEYLSFVVSHFSEYGYSAVPEPSTYAAIFGALALAFAACRRRK